ncbi:MAG TPA: hypothetical protein VNW92_16430 [Polyangiaceae bacterium]|nr:hypothetical protein [Polyangiaceae bacterium]
MLRVLCAAVLLLSACSSSSSGGSGADAGSGGSAGSAGAPSAGCPDVSGTWRVTAHCDATLVGMSLTVTETACALSFAAPFNGFTGSVSDAGKITLSGPQSCTGDATASAISMTCTPGTCLVKLAR